MVDFEFSLEKVLRVRAIREDKAQNQYLQARREKREVENQLQQASGKQEQLYNFLRKNDLSLEEKVQARNYMLSHREKINRIQEKLFSKKEKLNKKKDEMIKKRKKKEVLENLKEKEYERFYNNLLYKEQKQIDEIAGRAGSGSEI